MTAIEADGRPDVDPHDGRRALRMVDALAPFGDAGVLAAADVHVAQRLAALVGETDGAVLLGAALAVRAPRLGHVCTDLASVRVTATTDVEGGADVSTLPWPEPADWVERLGASALVATDGGAADGQATPPARALRLHSTRLYLDRSWRQERLVAEDLLARAASPATGVDASLLADGLDRLFPRDTDKPDLQRLAAASCVLRRVAVIGGGPGTGKTTTVGRVLALLHDQAAAGAAPAPRVALAAPTGKAAARLQEAVHAEARGVAWRGGHAPEGVTLHRLLGWRPGTRSRFRHGPADRLPHDVVVVDESSMVPLWLMAALLGALRADARLVLVGDPRQLASVEAGAVLGDVVGPAADGLLLRPAARAQLAAASRTAVDAADAPDDVAIGDGIVVLHRGHRFGGGIEVLARAIEAGDEDAAVAALSAGADDVRWLPADVDTPGAGAALEQVRADVVAAGRAVGRAARAGDAATALSALDAVRVLCAHRRGPAGATTWATIVEGWLAESESEAADGVVRPRGRWYPGRPLLVTENDHALRLYNGDTGVVVATPGGGVRAAFERGGVPVALSPSRLPAVDTVHATTVHKAQGSQFRAVVVILPDASSPLLTRELLYTAVTRARERLTVVGSENAVRAGVTRSIARASGLREALWGPLA